ncbi:hypothetical protein, partial [Cysteiniphilum halobium]|uniref:hypothetical protein n=1 Tax=Cysteiniphilum halobium TaxID=2219059 RepID=UPI0013C3608D
MKNILHINQILIALYVSVKRLAVIAISLLLISCSSKTSNDGSSSVTVSVTSNLPAEIAEDESGIYEMTIGASGALAGATNSIKLNPVTLGVIQGIGFPGVALASGGQAPDNAWTLLNNTSGLPDCRIGTKLTSDDPKCVLKAQLQVTSVGATVSGGFAIATDIGEVAVPVTTRIVSRNASTLAIAQMISTPMIGESIVTQIEVKNSEQSSTFINGLSLVLAEPIASLASDIIGGQVTTNADGSKTIAFDDNGQAKNLAKGSSHLFSF